MWGVLFLFALVGVLMCWWLATPNTLPGADIRLDSTGAQSKRRRGQKNKKGKQKSGASGSADTQVKVKASTDGGQRSPRRRESAGRPLDSREWPSLGGTNPMEQQQQKQEEETEEDLAALHAELLKVSRSATDVNRSSTAGQGRRGGRTGGGGGGSGRIGVGDKVRARFQAGPEWFPAIVTKTLHGGLVNVLYDDGERETRVPLSLVRHRDAPADTSSDSGDDSDSNDQEDEEIEARSLPIAHRSKQEDDGWEVMVQKPRKTRVQRVEARAEANTNSKNRLKRQRKREKEIAAREALRKML